jgi:hypothetical protein
LRGVPESFPGFKASQDSRTPAEILAHMGDLFQWGLSAAKGKIEWHVSKPLPWTQEVQRYFKALQAFDDYLASSQPLGASMEKLFQGPLADALTHTGHLTMLRRLAGCPMRSENYFKAHIAAGRVGAEQAAPVVEFD